MSLKASLNKIWSALNALQIIVLFPLLEELNIPVNVTDFNSGLIELATFELIDMEWLED